MEHSVAIIGGGPAGIAAAIQLKRYGILPLLFERRQLGGLLRNASLVENYPGFPQGIPGPDLVALFQAHLRRHDVPVIAEEATLVDYDAQARRFSITASSGSSYSFPTVVVATGTKPRTLDIAGSVPEVLRGRLLYEVWPIATARDKRVVIAGAGDAAFDYALNLSRYNEVWILNRGSVVRALPLLMDRALAIPRITYCNDCTVERIEAGVGTALAITALRRGRSFPLQADYLIAAVGRLPRKDCFSRRLVELEQSLRSQSVLYLIGDVDNATFRQATIAVGDGIRAAMRIYWQSKERA